MKEKILAGRSGGRLYPATLAASAQLRPVSCLEFGYLTADAGRERAAKLGGTDCARYLLSRFNEVGNA